AWRLCLVAHHMAIDAASLDVLMRDIGRLYPAIHDGGPPPPAQPAMPSWADIAAWEAAELSGPRVAALREFWAATLRGVPELLDMPTARPRPAEPSYRGATTVRPVPAGLLSRVDTLARWAGASRFMVLLASLAVVLHRY